MTAVETQPTTGNTQQQKNSQMAKLLYFSDQSAPLGAQLSQLFKHARTNTSLQNFIDRACAALRREVYALHGLERERLSDFARLAELWDKGRGHAAVQGALLCVLQCGAYISYRESHPAANDPLDSSSTPVFGLCTGLLAGAAVAASTTIATFVPLALEAVVIAFRIGLEAQRRADAVEPCGSNNGEGKESWSTVVGGGEEAVKAIVEKVKTFSKEANLPAGKEVYVSASSLTSITISGPSTSQKRLFETTLAGTRRFALPICAPYHARHLPTFSASCLSTSSSFAEAPVLRPVFSTSTGAPYIGETLGEMFQQMVDDILTNPIELDRLYIGLRAHLNAASCLEVLPFGPLHSAASIIAGFQGLDTKIVDTQLVEGAKENRVKDHRIAIVGMGGRFPGARNLDELWSVLERGLDLHKKVPKDRFDVDAHFDATGQRPNTSLTPYGCFIDNPSLFDATLFSMSPREAAQTDPMQRLALVTAYEALETAGYAPNRTPATNTHRIGTFFGQASDDWREVNSSQNIDTYFITGGIRAFVPGRLNYFYKWEGPSYSMDTACSSSLAATQYACTALINGECDTAVAGGVNVMTAPDIFAGLSRGFFLSKTGGCKTFDDGADGYCRADAVGTIILKRYEDAIADKDNIQAVILGALTNQSAEAVSITHPHAETQERLYKGMLEKAGIEGHEIDYVEMHGTGTQAGDANEIKSVINTFTEGRKKDRPVYVGAAKANMGHAEAASGITAIIKCLLMLRNNAIPPHVGIKKSINHHFPPLEPLGIQINTTGHLVPWHKPADRNRRIVVNNFSAAGGNTTLLMEDPPVIEVEGVDPRPAHAVVLSAKTATSLMHNVERLIRYLSEKPDTVLADLAYTTTARRMHHPFRKTVVGTSVAEVKAALDEFLASGTKPTRVPPSPVAFAFTGQGSHYVEMGKGLFNSVTSFKEDLVRFDALARDQDLPGFLGMIDGSLTNAGPVQTQLALCALEIALARLWMSWGLKPSVLVGHSIGEYAVLCTAGVLSVAETLYLVGRRATIMVEECTPGTHAMLAIKLSAAEVEDAIDDCKKSCEVSCYNSMAETVVSGPDAEIDGIVSALNNKGIRSTKLNIPFAFHSAQVDAIVARFAKVASTVTFRKPTIPVASSVIGELVTDEGVFSAEYLCSHARQPVRFLDAVDAASTHCGALSNGHKTAWIEMGPHPVCVRWVKASVCLPALQKRADDWTVVSNTMAALYAAGLSVDWSEFHRPFDASHRLLELPTYAFDEKSYWLQYKGDWALTKGNTVAAPTPAAKEDKVVSTFSTTSLQKVIAQDFSKPKGEVVFLSDLADPKLGQAVHGHHVHGVPLLPSSLYADMALTAASYFHSQQRPGEKLPGMGCAKMEVFAPVIGRQDGKPQLLQITASGSVDDGFISLRFTAIDDAGKKADKATCVVQYGDADAWLHEWDNVAYLVQSRISALQKAEEAGDGEVSKLSRGMAYKLFTAMVSYNESYQGMQQVHLDPKNLEATARVRFQTSEKLGDFGGWSPYAIDSIGHLSGFTVNCSGADDVGYLSHGWENLRVTAPFESTKTYRTYVRMRYVAKNMVAGDVYMFDGDKVVAVFGGLKFMEMKKTVLERLLPKPQGKAAAAPAAASAPTRAAPAPTPKRAGERPAATRPKTAAPAPATDGELAKIVKVIIEEVGCEPGDLNDSTAFEEIGIDSLLSLSILGRLRDTSSIDFPASLFLDHPTLGALKKWLSSVTGSVAQAPASPEPASDSSISSDEESGPDTGSATSAATTEPPSRSDEIVELFRNVIASEVGVEPAELTPSTDLAEMGVDSLMSLSILGALRDKTDMDLPSSFFQDYQTFGEIIKYLSPEPELKVTAKPAPAPAPKAAPAPKMKSLCVLLQGKPNPSKPSLFLLPDGSGSAAVYTNIPPVSLPGNAAIYGLNSPFVGQSEGTSFSVPSIAKTWLAEIRARQPHGPYLVGGWSFGGMAAYEVAAQLVAAGEKVQGIILVDSPSPVALPPLPISLVRFIAGTGLFGDVSKGMPEWLVAHFNLSIKALDQWTAPKVTGKDGKIKAVTVWARDGVCKNPEDERPVLPEGDWNGTVEWLVENRKQPLNDGGWQALVDVNGRVLGTSGNHFSMMKKENVGELGARIKEAYEMLV